MLASSPALAEQYAAPTHYAAWSVDWLFARTPLHLLWAGPEMVVIFFVLSGYVLALPAVKRGASWLDRSYYPRRLARLYLPVWGSVVVAAVAHALVSRHDVAGASWWLDAHAVGMSLPVAFKTASLASLSQGAWQYSSVLWSLQYEVAFSVLLPAFLWLALMTRDRPRGALALAAASLAVTAVGAATDHGALRYMPIFMLGCLLAFHTDRLRPRRVPATATLALTLLGIVLLTTGYWAQDTGIGSAGSLAALAIVVGACVIVWLAIVSQSARDVLDTRPVRWLGSRSFSLYLVHEPIVVALAFALGGRPGVGTLLLIAVPLSLLVAEVFWVVVENPSIKAARALGRLARGRAGIQLSAPGEVQNRAAP